MSSGKKKPPKRKILIVDDDPEMIELLSSYLAIDNYIVFQATTGETGLDLIKIEKPDLVVLDINLPMMGGLDALKSIREKSKSYISVLLLSGNSTTEEIVAGLDAGADDYIVKPFAPEEFLARVRTQLRIKDLNDQLKAANEKLKELVVTDDLTGLLNMRSMYKRLDYEIQRSKRFGRTVCVVMMDLDYFKNVNDDHDHLFGSFVLSEVGKLIKKSIRAVDIGARYGGDEFMMILTEADKQGALLFCERLRSAIESHDFQKGSDQMKLTASFGFAVTDPKNPDIDPEQFLRIADKALYDAKGLGRNRICFYDLAQNPEMRTAEIKSVKFTSG